MYIYISTYAYIYEYNLRLQGLTRGEAQGSSTRTYEIPRQVRMSFSLVFNVCELRYGLTPAEITLTVNGLPL